MPRAKQLLVWMIVFVLVSSLYVYFTKFRNTNDTLINIESPNQRYAQSDTLKTVESSNQINTQSTNDDLTTVESARQMHTHSTIAVKPYTKTHASQSTPFKNKAPENKIIYFYNPLNYHKQWVGKDGWETTKVFRNCPVSNCIVSKKSGNMDVAGAVIFKARDLTSCPNRTKRGQIWIFCEFESPEYFYYPNVIKQCNGKVNWTLSYRRDADFHVSHGYFRKRRKPTQEKMDFKTKDKMAVIFISHCDDPVKRMAFVKELQSNKVDVDVYGTCGNLTCSNGDRFKVALNITKTEKSHCFKVLDTKYKFYLSLENAFCLDYVTEKSLDLVMKRKIVPIVRDGVNHTIYHPPGSYIDASEFSTVKQLADYIIKLDKDMNSYKKFHEWRQHYYTEGFRQEWDQAFCDICKHVHSPGNYRRLYADIHEWFIKPGGNSSCHRPKGVLH